MTTYELLRILYSIETPFLQTNDWSRLKTRVADLVTAACPPSNPTEVLDLLRSLRLDGEVMFLPDWDHWGIEEDEADGQLIPSRTQWEPRTVNADPPDWISRGVFMPNELKHWYVRSRVAETARILFANRERFGLEAATAHLGYQLQVRTRPDRTSIQVASVVSHLQGLVDAGEFSKARNGSELKLALQVVGAALGHSTIAAFQGRAWESILRSILGAPKTIDATMITAGVSSGKTDAFLLPTLTLLVYRVLSGEAHRNRALIIYPRTSLVEDQYHGLTQFLRDINSQLAIHRPGITLTDRPALDAGQLLAQSLDLPDNSLSETLPEVERRGIEVILTTPESLKNRMLDARAVRSYLRHVEVVVFDEIHLMEGVAGCHGIYFIRRLRQLLRSLRHDSNYEPAWVGASATVAEPVEHCARVLSLDPNRVTHIYPAPAELMRFGTFHHLFVHTRVGKPSISAVTNGLSCLVHTRNNCTAFVHYIDPGASTLQAQPSVSIPKTLVFVDSLSTIGRLRFTTADNEKTYEPFDLAPPYYSWFYRPASRFGAPATEVKSIGTERLKAVRDWCQKCYHGVPARIDGAVLRSQEFGYLRTGLRMDDRAKARATPPGFDQELRRLSGPIGNLDQCPFHKFRTCWWFSQDSGERRTIGNGRIPLDQNRAIAYTSKTDDPEIGLRQNVNDFFLTNARELWERTNNGGIPNQTEAVSTLLASPRIEVGVDFRNVRDGVTHKALRSAASFQQKVGRVGREENSDSLILTFLAHRPADAHFAHQPARLIDSAYLDPIPLKSENPDVLRSHMFVAALEFIASQPPGAIPNAGNELNLIGTGSGRVVDSWEGKVRACIDFFTANRSTVRGFILGATNQESSVGNIADGAIDKIIELLRIFVADLSGAYSVGGTAAHWFKENQRPIPSTTFTDVISGLQEVRETLEQALISSPPLVEPAINALIAEVLADTPTSTGLLTAAGNLQSATISALQSGLQASTATLLIGAVAKAQATSSILTTLTFSTPLPELKVAYEVVEAFFEKSEQAARITEQYYLHDILTKLVPFRRFYPFGLVRTHFQHVNARQVRISLPDDTEDFESLGTALYELLPGTWNYRWLQPRKSPCDSINQIAGSGEHFINLSTIEGPNRAAFERTGATLTSAELPSDMPGISVGSIVPILRPIRLRMVRAFNRPEARYDNQLIADDDEAPRVADPQHKRSCPTLPRAFPATWYRVTQGSSTPVVGEAEPGHATLSVPHTYPAIGRVLFQTISFSTRLRTDRYVYAIDRSYGAGAIESPRIHYRHGGVPRPVVIGDTMGNTDGLTFRLSDPTIATIVAACVTTPGVLRGEVTIRALRRFISRAAGTGPFQAEMIRKVVLMEHLDNGGTLSTLDAGAVQACVSSMTKARYDRISSDLIDGVYAGVEAAEAAMGRSRQASWYDDAWIPFQAVQSAVSGFTPQFVGEVGRDILMHTLAVTVLDAVSRLVGAGDGDLSYFHHSDRGELYIFDSVEGGNGCAETIGRFLQIPPLRRIVAARASTSGALPSADGFMLIEENLGTCPAQSASRLLVETCRMAVSDPAELQFPTGQVADLQARIRHEYDPITGARAIVDHLFRNQPSIFRDWPDLLWLQVLPERFADGLVSANVTPNLESIRSRSHLCISGCIECVDNGDQSVYGALTSREHVSKNLVDALRVHIVANEPQAFLVIPAGTDVGNALQANSGQPVTDTNGSAITAVIDEDGTPRQILLTRVLSTVVPDLSITGGALLTQATPGPGWTVNLPFLAGYRDERPTL